MGRKLILLSLFVVLAEVACFGQFGTPVTSVEAIETHYGEVGDYDLAGFTTYRVYVHLENDDFFLSAIFANPVTPDQPEPIFLNFTSDCEIFQHPEGSFTAEGNQCLSFPFYPALEYDSWLTIGKECQNDDGSVEVAMAIPDLATVQADFNEDGGIGTGFLDVEDGAIFTTTAEPNGIPILDDDGNWKVLVAQFTTCGSFEFEFGISVVQEGIPGNEEVDTVVTDPCTDNPLDTESAFSSLTCFEDSTGMIDIETVMQGNGNVTFDLYQLMDPNDTLLQEDNTTGDFTDLHAGDYYVIASDELGCEIISDTFNLTQPDLLTLTSNVEQQVICAGENIGEISYEAEGGVEPYDLYFADGGTQIPTDSLATGLPCGSYETILEDSAGCTTSVFNQLDCPDPIQINLQTDSASCFEACDGSISGTVEGGSGELSYSWTGCDDFTSTDLELTDLCPCDSLVLEVTDDSLCVVTSGMLEINQPDELTLTSTVTDVSCFGEESGSINTFAEGGTGTVVIDCTDESNNVLDDTNALGAGTYYCTATDQNLCSVTDTLVINQPDQPLSINLIDSVRPTCTGFTDGLISVEASGGTPGTSGYSYSITPDPNAPSTGPVFDNLPGNEYAVTVMDSLGCTSILTLNLTEPDPLTFEVETGSVTCPGGSDGTLLITESGGDNPYTYTVTDSEDTVLSQVNGFFQGLQADTFNITVTDNDGCFSMGTTILNEPDSIVAEVQTAVNVTCFGNCNGAVSFDITGGTPEYEVVWNGDPTYPNDSLCSGTNQFAVTDSAGCEITGEFEVEFDSGQIDLEFLDENATCTGMSDGSATVLATGGLGELTINAGGINLDSLMSGEYLIQVEDSIGCTALDTLVIEDDNESDLSLQVFSSPVTCWNESDGTATAAVSGAEGEVSYHWNDPEEQSTATAVGLPEDIYTVIVKDSISVDHVCTFIATTSVEPTEGCFFVATALTPNGDGANDEWVVGGLEHFPNSLVQVYNRWGQLMFESRGYPTRWDGRFNGKRLPVADYYYVITFEESGLKTLTGTVTIKY